MKGLCHVERSVAKSRHLRIVPTTVALGTDSKATRLGGERDFSTPLSAFAEVGYGGRAAPLKMTAGECAAYHGVQCGRVFASALIAKNPRSTRVVVEKSAFFSSSTQKHWAFDANMGDPNRLLQNLPFMRAGRSLPLREPAKYGCFLPEGRPPCRPGRFCKRLQIHHHLFSLYSRTFSTAQSALIAVLRDDKTQIACYLAGYEVVCNHSRSWCAGGGHGGGPRAGI